MIVTSLRGYEVDTSGEFWVLDEKTTLGVSPPEAAASGSFVEAAWDATKSYIRHLISTSSAGNVRSIAYKIRRALGLPGVEHILSDGGPNVLGLLLDSLSSHVSLTYSRLILPSVRSWYVWCADSGFPIFDADVANAMASTSIRRARPGTAVLRLDRRSGPLRESEARSLERALWGALGGKLSLKVVVASLLMIQLGPNPENLRQLQECDLLPPRRPGGPYVLMMPRIKKAGKKQWRSGFTEREIIPELGMAIQQLIDENRSLPEQPIKSCERPLFRRSSENVLLVGTDFEENSLRIGRNFFQNALSLVRKALDLKDVYGKRLHLFPRRLRYTFAKRRVAAGASPEDLMHDLDHSNIQCVLIYYNGGLEIVPQIDKVMHRTFEGLSDLFFGRTTSKILESDPTFAMLLRAPTPKMVPAPSACLSCAAFRPRSPSALKKLIDLVEGEPRLSIDVAVNVRRNARETLLNCEVSSLQGKRGIEFLDPIQKG